MEQFRIERVDIRFEKQTRHQRHRRSNRETNNYIVHVTDPVEIHVTSLVDPKTNNRITFILGTREIFRARARAL